MNAVITPQACKINRALARRAWRAIKRNTPLSRIDETELDRLLACGQCKWSGVGADIDMVMETVWIELVAAVSRVEEMNWDGQDPEVARERKRERDARLRADHAEDRAEYMREWRAARKAAVEEMWEEEDNG